MVLAELADPTPTPGTRPVVRLLVFGQFQHGGMAIVGKYDGTGMAIVGWHSHRWQI